MKIYLVARPFGGSGQTKIDDIDAAIVHAADGAAAIVKANELFGSNKANWADATATELPTGPSWNGYSFTVEIEDLDPVTVEGSDALSTVDLIGAALATALNLLPEVAAAAYNSSTNTLTAAATTDGLGDAALTVTITAPDGTDASDLFGTVTDGGASGDALTVVLPAEDDIGARVYKAFKQVGLSAADYLAG